MARAEKYNEMSNKVFLRNVAVQYWYFVLIFGLIIIGGIIGFILTLNEYIDTSTIGGQGTWTFDQFSMGTGVEWIIFLFFWPLVIVGVPVLVITGFIAAVIWYEVFNIGLKEEIKFRSKREEEKRRRFGKTSESSGLFGFFMFVGVCVYVALDGNWMTEFGNLSLRYFVDAWIAVFLWFIAICSIGIAIGIVWFVKKYES
ncbi:MAG: hypothetical protein ACXAC6_13690 [Candidatus Hodarchaeales archaeon]|jgi:hypothetical protein